MRRFFNPRVLMLITTTAFLFLVSSEETGAINKRCSCTIWADIWQAGDPDHKIGEDVTSYQDNVGPNLVTCAAISCQGAVNNFVQQLCNDWQASFIRVHWIYNYWEDSDLWLDTLDQQFGC